jgi:hypothetical protein
MTPSYQGRALDGRPARPRGRLGRILRVLGVLAVMAALAHLPWGALRKRFAVVTDVRVTGLRYLDPAQVVTRSGLAAGDDLFAVDLVRARQRLLLDSRIAGAEVTRRLPRGVRIAVNERSPVLLVDHGVPWEVDGQGVLLEPLEPGVVADVPRLVGPRFGGQRAGTHLGSPEVARGLRWAERLSDRSLQLSGQVSELDVSHPDVTALTLLTGTRVLAPAWPPSLRRLSALRVVLADLGHKGTVANEVDLRFENQVIVRPVVAPEDGRSG